MYTLFLSPFERKVLLFMERICSQREHSPYRLGPFSEGDGCAGKETESLESFLSFEK